MSYAERQEHKIKTGKLVRNQIAIQSEGLVTPTAVKTSHPEQLNLAAVKQTAHSKSYVPSEI
jgi:hypothetical protein